MKKPRKKRHKKLTGLKPQLIERLKKKKNQRELSSKNISKLTPSSEIISKLEHGHAEGQTVTLLALMEETGFDYNDLRERKAWYDARLAAGKYVEQERIDELFRWHEAEHSRALNTRDDKFFEGQAAAIRAIKTGKLKTHLFDAAVGQACALIVWANRAQQNEPINPTAVLLWREQRQQREKNIARRMHGRKINPKVAEEMERERARQKPITDSETESERAERLRKRDEQMLANEKPMTPSQKRAQRKKQRDHLPYAVREEKRQAERLGSYLADFAPTGKRVRLTAEGVANAKYPAKDADGQGCFRPYFPIQYLAADTIKVYERTFTGDKKRKAMSRFYDAISESAERLFGFQLLKQQGKRPKQRRTDN